MTLSVKPLDPDAFLERARPYQDRNIFLVGTFERAITIHRQQVRALNLIYAIVNSRKWITVPKLERDSPIAIVGGGAFGVTAAAAAACVGFDAYLFERHQSLLPLQRGCDTRWVNPRYYDWPANGSETRYSRLPILEWEAGTAGQVAADIEERFWKIAEGKKNRLHCFREVFVNVEHINDGRDGFEVTYNRPADQNVLRFDAVIYAVGFGVESSASPSYWRNDELSQIELGLKAGEKTHYVVSGTGDGGLTDVFRLTIRDFRHEHILSDLFGDADEGLLDKLRALQSSAQDCATLFDGLNDLAGDDPTTGLFGPIVKRLQARLRSDTSVTLNGKEPSPRTCVQLGRVSFSNALLFYLLFRIRAVHYEAGELDLTDPKKPILVRAAAVGTSEPPSWFKSKFIVRHGTQREQPLKAFGFEDVIPELKKLGDDGVDTGLPIYPDGWWSQFTQPDLDPKIDGVHLQAPVEFVPPAIVVQATTFVSTLADVLADISDRRASQGRSEAQFRITLHRIAQFSGQHYFQQVTPYAGHIDKTGGSGRIFPVAGGIVGLVCRTGSLVVTRKNNEEQFRKVWRLAHLEDVHARAIEPYVDAIFACPFFAPILRDRVEEHVALVLFADSAQADFFNDAVLQIISAACRGFVKNLDHLCAIRALIPIRSGYRGYPVPPPSTTAELVASLKALGVEFDNANFKSYKSDLTFRIVPTLDLELGNSDRLFRGLPPRS